MPGQRAGSARSRAAGVGSVKRCSAQRARRRRGADDRDAARRSSSKLAPGPVGLEPGRPAGAREQPRHRRVVALRDAALLEHLGRAVGPGVAAVGAELHAAARWSKAEPWRAPRPVIARRRSRGPARAQPQRRALHGQLDHEPVAVKAQLDAARTPVR